MLNLLISDGLKKWLSGPPDAITPPEDQAKDQDGQQRPGHRIAWTHSIAAGEPGQDIYGLGPAPVIFVLVQSAILIIAIVLIERPPEAMVIVDKSQIGTRLPYDMILDISPVGPEARDVCVI